MLVCHMEKYKASDIGGIQTEDNRESDEINKKNRNLDLSRKHLNLYYNYDTGNGEIYLEKRSNLLNVIRYHKNRINFLRRTEGKKPLRKDAVVCCSFIIGADKEFMDSLTREQQIAFFKEVAEWFDKHYGFVLGFSIHYDENTPHMHLRIMPEIEVGRLSAKEMFTRATLGSIQRELPKYLNSKGYAVEEGQHENKVKHLNELDFKIKAEQEKFSALCADAFVLRTEIEKLNNEKEGIERTIERVKQTKLDELDALVNEAHHVYEQNLQLRQSVREFEKDFQNHVEQAYAEVFDEKDIIRARTRAEAVLEPRRSSLDRQIREASEAVRKSQEQAHRARENPKKKDWGDR